MPIINQVVKGSGGGSTVAEPYLEYSVNASGNPVSTTSRIINLSGVKNIPTMFMAYAYADNTNISGGVSFSDVENIASNGMSNTFFGCTNITSFSMPNVKAVYIYGCDSVCKGATGLVSVNMENLACCSGQAFQEAFNGCTSLSQVNLNALQGGYENNWFAQTFYRCGGVTTISLPNLIFWNGGQTFGYSGLQSISIPTCIKIENGGDIFSYTPMTTVVFDKLQKPNLTYAFRSCQNLTSVSFAGLVYSTGPTVSNNGFANMLYGCNGVTVHFPAEWETTMQSWSNVTSGFSGTNTTVLFDLPNITALDLSCLPKLILIPNALSNVYYNCVNITSVDLSSVESVQGAYAFSDSFKGCTSLVSANISSLVSLPSQNIYGVSTIQGPMKTMFQDCSALTSVDLSSLKYAYAQSAMDDIFKNSGLTTLNLPSLAQPLSYGLSFMLRGTTGVTVHLPANLSGNTYNFGGTNTTILFDLPSTAHLTGADTVEYERNPKYDTATALAWRVKDTGEINNLVIDWTPFYTSGTTDPAVGNTIYSDSACTTAVTTISAIA